MLNYRVSSLPPGRRSGRHAADPRRGVSPNSPAYYLGIPARVWVDVMSRRIGRRRPERRKAA
jgi:hypothetical protein